MSTAGDPRGRDDADDGWPDAARLRAVPPPDAGSASPFDDMVAEVVWHGGGAERDFDALLRLIFDPILEQLHDAERADYDGDACPW